MKYNPMSLAPGGSAAGQQTLSSGLATNTSRLQRIDDIVQPGPYKELLPCEDLCWNLVKACPAALGFGCPSRGRGLEAAYGARTAARGVSCSFPGAVYLVGAAPGLLRGGGLGAVLAAALLAVVVGRAV